MPRRANYHIPAPVRQARAPGASYCGVRERYKKPDPFAMRRWVVEMAQGGHASQFCPACLAGMLRDGARAAERGKAWANRRMIDLTPEMRLEIARKAVTTRWDAYRARKAATQQAQEGA